MNHIEANRSNGAVIGTDAFRQGGKGWARNLIAGVLARLYAARGAFILLFVAASLALALASAWSWLAAKRDNATIAGLQAGEDIEIDPAAAAPEVLFARTDFLLKRDHMDEAQGLLDQARLRADAKTRVAMLYNMANTRLRAVFDAIEQGQFDKAGALVGLAKDHYTEALRLDPQAWDVKYNLDVASRLVRDLPEATPPNDPSREPPQDIWTDLPGVPKGEP